MTPNQITQASIVGSIIAASTIFSAVQIREIVRNNKRAKKHEELQNWFNEKYENGTVTNEDVKTLNRELNKLYGL